MTPRRLLPYLVALVLLAWLLGSLARSGGGTGSLLSNSVWLVYLVELSPLVGVGLMILLIASLVRNWRLLSDAIGFRMARRPGKRKSRRLEVILWTAAWLVAVMVLFLRCGGIVCSANASVQDAAITVKNLTIGSGPLPNLPSFVGSALSLASLVDTNYLVWAFFGILGVSSVIMVRALKVSWDETRSLALQKAVFIQQVGQAVIRDAIQLLDDTSIPDPRTRIILCYQMMINRAASLGAPVEPDRTARELEKAIRVLFQLAGPNITHLTALFEEARYSLHPMSEGDARLAHDSLVGIRAELSNVTSLEA